MRAAFSFARSVLRNEVEHPHLIWDEGDKCVPDQVRVFDLIPENGSGKGKSCYVDESGKCRKTLKLRNMFGGDLEDGFSELMVPVSSSKDRSSLYNCTLRKTCDG